MFFVCCSFASGVQTDIVYPAWHTPNNENCSKIYKKQVRYTPNDEDRSKIYKKQVRYH
jgi:hypothetical protein